MNSNPSSKSTESLNARMYPLVTGASVGIAIPLAEDVERAVLDSVGPWAAFGIGLIAAAGAGAAISIIINLICLYWRASKEPANGNATS